MIVAVLVLLLCANAFAVHPDCAHPLKTGMCEAYIPSYGYDTVKKECVSFVYGGCDGNANRFPTKEACEKKCLEK